MKTNDVGAGFIIGSFISSVMLVIAFCLSDEAEKYNEVVDLIAECESTLPRNETCMIIAVPSK
jgi:hypothetical protein